MKVAIACDHGGLPLKPTIVEVLESCGHEVIDLGARQLDPEDDYPDYARYAGQAVQHGQAERAIVLCGSGVGASVAANKMTGVRAAVCHDTYSAGQGVEHDNMNVLCIGARIVGVALAKHLVQAFISAKFNPAPRFTRRLDKVKAIESQG